MTVSLSDFDAKEAIGDEAMQV